MTYRPYEHDLGAFYLTIAPAHLDDDAAALAMMANLPGISTARVKHGLACRHYVTTGDESRIEAYFAAADIRPDYDFDAAMVAAGRREVERMRMLEWECTGIHPDDTDPDSE